MNEHPILFSGRMVRAILDGSKTQTRRVMNPQPYADESGHWIYGNVPESWSTAPDWLIAKSPYGGVGHWLWVRETFGCNCHNSARPMPDCEIVYRATGDSVDDPPLSGWCPSIYMPRWASRITLSITRVRVQRLKNIAEIDCEHELGVEPYSLHNEAVPEFRLLWDSINAKRGYGWDANPWVWAIDFKRLDLR